MKQTLPSLAGHTQTGRAAMRHKLIFFILCSVQLGASAASTACPEHYAGGQAPDIVNVKLAAQTQELCNIGFVVMHSGTSRTPLWSAEHLTRTQVQSAHGVQRRNAFHPDSRLPRGQRAELKDYARSGYDRGHMSPSGDMPDASAQLESFALSNMVPQNPQNNRHLWEGIESAVRQLALQRGELYVITGPLFTGAQLKRINRVLVPSHLFKLVFDARRNEAGAYLAANEDTDNYQRVSVNELEQMAGITLLPGVPVKVKAVAMTLPQSHPYAGRRR